MKARILLSVKTKKEFYIDAVEQVGAIATAKYLPEIDTDYDGLILCGGSDINPEYYGEKINGSKNIDYERDESEFAIAKEFIKSQKPILGICRGYQLLNIIFGGSMHQDIPNADIHCSFSDYDLVHNVNACEDSIIGKIYGTEFAVNSFHHQAIKELGQDFKITATFGDVVEAIEHKTLPILGVQWHPERMCFTKKREDTVDGSKIFKYFVELCEKQRDNKN